MADGTKIEWTEATWNPITGCSVKSPGCKRCYAMLLAGTRLSSHPSRAGLTVNTKAGPVWTGEVRFNEQWLDQPLRWKRPRMIFVCAHGDLFHESVPDAWIDQVFAVMALCPQHTFQVLTKRSARMREYACRLTDANEQWERLGDAAAILVGNPGYVSAGEREWPLPNVWLGVSVEDQQRADERRGDFESTPAAVKFVSYEPALQPVDWSGWEFVEQIICGGESGPNARRMHPDCPRGALAFCEQHGIAFFFKQWGEYAVDEIGPGDPRSLQYPPGHVIYRKVGKKAAGRKLFGVEHNGMPGHA